jgi:hypothetical protein
MAAILVCGWRSGTAAVTSFSTCSGRSGKSRSYAGFYHYAQDPLLAVPYRLTSCERAVHANHAKKPRLLAKSRDFSAAGFPGLHAKKVGLVAQRSGNG